jgi:acylphosphatase
LQISLTFSLFTGVYASPVVIFSSALELSSGHKGMSSRQVFFHFSFRVSGKVQGVFFRKFTQAKATELKLGGWVANTADGNSVTGEAEGEKAALERFRLWLSKEGSPKSVIERAEFTDEYEIKEEPKFGGVFSVRK